MQRLSLHRRSILHHIKLLLPKLYQGLLAIQNAWATPRFEAVLAEQYNRFEPVSIDYGIMEHAKPIFTMPGRFGWDDAGSWLVLERIHRPDEDGNHLWGDTAAISSKNSIIMGGKRFIAAVGLEDLIVVDTDDALLICHKDSSQDIKKMLERLKATGRAELL